MSRQDPRAGPNFAEQAEERGVTTGVNPAGFVADCLYKSGEEQGKWVTQRTVAETGNGTPTTDWTHQETFEDQIARPRSATSSDVR